MVSFGRKSSARLYLWQVRTTFPTKTYFSGDSRLHTMLLPLLYHLTGEWRDQGGRLWLNSTWQTGEQGISCRLYKMRLSFSLSSGILFLRWVHLQAYFNFSFPFVKVHFVTVGTRNHVIFKLRHTLAPLAAKTFCCSLIYRSTHFSLCCFAF